MHVNHCCAVPPRGEHADASPSSDFVFLAGLAMAAVAAVPIALERRGLKPTQIKACNDSSQETAMKTEH